MNETAPQPDDAYRRFLAAKMGGYFRRTAKALAVALIVVAVARAEARDIYAECARRCREGGVTCESPQCQWESLLTCECTPTGGVRTAKLESLDHDRCVRLCGWEKIRTDKECTQDFERSRCVGTTAEAIQACNVGLRATQASCLAMAKDVRQLCDRTCNETTEQWEAVWPVASSTCAVPMACCEEPAR